MTFKNELTYLHVAEAREEERFHETYESAVKAVSEDFSEKQELSNVINGKPVKSKGKWLKKSPADTTLVMAKMQAGDKEDVNKAVKAARTAFKSWSQTEPSERVKVFQEAARLLSDHKYEISALLTFDNGKNRYEAMADVDEAIDFMRFYAAEMDKNDGYSTPLATAYKGEKSMSFLRPYGVWAVVCPFNFPVAISLGMSSAAMITGNTVVVKPSTLAPYALRKVFDILDEAGLPPGVANYIAGSGKDVGEPLVAHPDIDGVVFTGSKAVGYDIIRKSLRDKPIPVIAEMGSKNPVIVTLDADMEKAVEGVINSAFGYGGQKCSAASRLYVQMRIKDDFEEELVKRCGELKVMHPALLDCSYGPVIEEKKVDDFEKYVAMGKKDGKVLCGGHRLTDGYLGHGYYVEPTIISELPEDHWMMKNELFLPILTTQPFDQLEDAVAMANSTSFGLTAGIFSEEEDDMDYFFKNIESGVVYSNRRRGACTGAMVGAQAFVGWKASGSTGKGTGSVWYLQQFMREQTRTVVLG
ncbi:MAG TPA: aldehyde dehydrogenase family protein [Methanomassiliicoccales archaeon]|nr:aldehyde dehydrogenase family protein [Methanomassiliicoccales archaeon]